MSKPKDDVPVEYLRSIFDYDQECGLLIHKGRFNVKPGMIAGSVKSPGYMGVKIHGKAYYVHRVIWAIVTGAWPKHQIDHVNLVKTDNRWVNLRQATISQNKANIRAMSWKNLKGAYRAENGRWRARVGDVHVGYFASEEEAHLAYVRAAAILYGEFARA